MRQKGSDITGIIAMLVTPFDKNENIDYGALRAEVDWCAAQGADGVVATPSIGEFACLTTQERHECFRVVAEAASKHKGLRKLATIAAPYSREVIEHARCAIDLGFEAAQLVPPYYWVPDEDEVYAHYKTAASTGLPIIVYHNPQLSKFYMTREFIARLLDIPGVVGIKEVKTDRHIELEPLFKLARGKANVFNTYRALTTGLLLGGAGGFINAFAIPACVRILQLWKAGRQHEAEEIQNLVNEVFPRGGEANKRHIGTTKLMASTVTGIDFGKPRSPYMLPEREVGDTLKAALPALEAMLRQTADVAEECCGHKSGCCR